MPTQKRTKTSRSLKSIRRSSKSRKSRRNSRKQLKLSSNGEICFTTLKPGDSIEFYLPSTCKVQDLNGTPPFEKSINQFIEKENGQWLIGTFWDWVKDDDTYNKKAKVETWARAIITVDINPHNPTEGYYVIEVPVSSKTLRIVAKDGPTSARRRSNSLQVISLFRKINKMSKIVLPDLEKKQLPSWSTEDVAKWLKLKIKNINVIRKFVYHNVTGSVLLHLRTRQNIQEQIGIAEMYTCSKIIKQIELLKQKMEKAVKVKIMNELLSFNDIVQNPHNSPYPIRPKSTKSDGLTPRRTKHKQRTSLVAVSTTKLLKKLVNMDGRHIRSASDECLNSKIFSDCHCDSSNNTPRQHCRCCFSEDDIWTEHLIYRESRSRSFHSRKRTLENIGVYTRERAELPNPESHPVPDEYQNAFDVSQEGHSLDERSYFKKRDDFHYAENALPRALGPTEIGRNESFQPPNYELDYSNDKGELFGEKMFYSASNTSSTDLFQWLKATQLSKKLSSSNLSLRGTSKLWKTKTPPASYSGYVKWLQAINDNISESDSETQVTPFVDLTDDVMSFVYDQNSTTTNNNHHHNNNTLRKTSKKIKRSVSSVY